MKSIEIILIDNYDSFTYNLYQLLGSFDRVRIDVFRNDQVTFQEIVSLQPDAIVLSPGPGNPQHVDDFGVCIDILSNLAVGKPILGVCLGMQGIGLYNGGRIISANRIVHGKTSMIYHSGRGLFDHIPQEIKVARYHSLIIDAYSIPEDLIVTARTEENEIMGIQHRTYPVFGVQFHPESFMTQYGRQMMHNFLQIITQHQQIEMIEV